MPSNPPYDDDFSGTSINLQTGEPRFPKPQDREEVLKQHQNAYEDPSSGSIWDRDISKLDIGDTCSYLGRNWADARVKLAAESAPELPPLDEEFWKWRDKYKSHPPGTHDLLDESRKSRERQLLAMTRERDAALDTQRELATYAATIRGERDTALERVRELENARYEPFGDNHHNAMKCPYCNPTLAAEQRTHPSTNSAPPVAMPSEDDPRN